jgi:uncharacterized repeat protein (TIGR03803 family)
MKILRIPLVIVLVVVAGRTFTANAQTVTETVLHSFTGYPTDGSDPVAGLVQGSNGNFYGTTPYGGIDDIGTVFRISPSGTYTDLYSSGSSGAESYAGLVQGSDGNFYGTTTLGGTTFGTVFRISPSGSYTKLHSFAGYPTDGANPYAGLVQGSDGNFYGTTEFGGTGTNCDVQGCGTVFRISPSGGETILHSFGDSPGDGDDAQAGLVQGSDGNFYGTTQLGGTHHSGTVFRIDPSGTETTLYSFVGSPYDGSEPRAGLVQGSDGNFYGTTTKGGPSTNCFDGCGTVFQISPSGSEAILYSFVGHPTDGAEPYAGLVQGSDGNFYGTTVNGGPSTNFDAATGLTGYGTVFRISPSGDETILYYFPGSPNDGVNPEAGLIQGSDGNFYGTTQGGGTSTNFNPDTGDIGYGTVFKLDVGLGQISTNCTLSINPTNAVFDAVGGSDSVSVTAPNGCDWSATSNDSFITIISDSSGSGNGPVHYTVAANTSTNEQVGTMTIAGQTFTVTESGTTSSSGSCAFTLSPLSIDIVAKGGNKTISVKSKNKECSWTAFSGDPSFIFITKGSSGTNNGAAVLAVATNPEAVARTGTVSIAEQTVTVVQQAAKCAFALDTNAVTFTSEGGTGSVAVSANGGACAWKVVNKAKFVTITSASEFTGDGTVTYNVETNSTTRALNGTLTIAGKTYKVTQEAAP